MASPRVGNIERQDSESEHIGPDYSGDNISAKKVATYGWDAVNSQWRRVAVDASGNYNISASISGADGAITDGVTPSIKATVADLANSNPLAVEIVDGSGNQITSFGGGTQYADGAGRGTATGTIAMGDDGTNIQAMKVSNTGVLSVDGSAVTQPVSLINGFISTNNSSSTPLGIAGTYTGTAEDITKYAAVGIFVGTDRSGTLYYDSSTDGTNWDKTESYPVTITTGGVTEGFFFQSQAHTKYYRIRYINGGTAQGSFRLQTTLRDVPGTAEVLSVNIPMIGATDALTTKSVIYGVTTGGGGGYVAVKTTPSGSLTTAGQINDGTDTMLITAAGEANVLATAQPGVDIGDVTINNAVGASAVNIQDGGNSITVDGVVTASLAAGTNNIGDVDVLTVNGVAPAFGSGVRGATVQRVTIATDDVVPITDNGGSLTVDGTITANAGSGTFTVAGAVTTSGTVTEANSASILTSVQLLDDPVATLGTTTYTEAVTKGNIIGAVRRDANTTLVDTTNEISPLQVNATGELKVVQIQALPTGANLLGKVGIDQATANANEVVTKTGSVTTATLSAETTKVIGVTRTADGAGNLLTSNSTTPTAKFSQDTNITSILGTAPTAVGKLDIKGADGDVFVRQATAANLKMDLSGSAANATAGLFSVKIDQTTPGTTNNVAVTPPTLTKATQGSTGFSTQDLKDAGRSSIMITATVASTATAETLITITKSAGLATTGTSTSTTVTTGKRFRIQAITASARNSTGTTAGVATIKLRAAVAGATSATSPLQLTSSVALPAAATSVNFPNINIPDGFEIDSNGATNTYGVTITHPQWVTGSVVATFDISIIGYEY